MTLDCLMGSLGLQKILNYHFRYVMCFRKFNSSIKAIIRQLELLIAYFYCYWHCKLNLCEKNIFQIANFLSRICFFFKKLQLLIRSDLAKIKQRVVATNSGVSATSVPDLVARFCPYNFVQGFGGVKCIIMILHLKLIHNYNLGI